MRLRALTTTTLALLLACGMGVQTAGAVETQQARDTRDRAMTALDAGRRDLDAALADATHAAGIDKTGLSETDAALADDMAAALDRAHEAMTAAVTGADEWDKAGLDRQSDEAVKAAADAKEAMKALKAASQAVSQAHEAKLLADAKAGLDAAVKAARERLDSSAGNVDDETSRTALSDRLNTVDKATDVEAMNALAAELDADRAKVDEAVQARADRLAAEEAARQAAAQAAAQAATYYGGGSTSYAGGSGYYGGSSYSYGGGSGFTSGDCYSVAGCQAALADGSMQAFHTAGGSTFYGVHDWASNGLWGSTSVTINGSTQSVGQWQQAQYINGTPYAPDDGGTYVQTCHDGQVWYAPVG